jgi:hypothetical protein
MIVSGRLFGDDERRGFRRRYRVNRGWSFITHAATTIGLLSAVTHWGWGGPIAGILTLALLAAAIGAAVSDAAVLHTLPRLAWIGLVTGAVLTAVAGLVAVFQAAGLLVVLLLVCTSPALIAAVRVLGHCATDTPETVPIDGLSQRAQSVQVVEDLAGFATSSTEDLAGLDDASLCLAWRRSFLLLEAAESAEHRIAVVQYRERCLDELQRRCPQGVAAWFSSGARASGNPLPFLNERPHPPA